jgi:sodium/potassium/calcium exchanger 4
LGILAGILVIVSTTFYAVSLGSNGSSTHRRQLLSSGAEWEQCGYEQQHSPGGFIFLYALLTFHLFLGVAILCDDYFVPSLEGISEALNLSEDVAGATFMAAG